MSILQKSLRYTGMFGALAGSIFTIIQLVLLLFKQDTICFNDGCAIVETMTAVSPIFFNLAGFLFFQAVFWTLYYTKLKDSYWPILSQALLIAGLAAEGVLVGYQNFVVEVFCSYCLVIFGVVVFLNLLQGVKHIFFGIAIFLAIQIAFASLQFSTPNPDGGFTLDKGVIATMDAANKDKQFYLFFSSTCEHCEEVIQTLEEYPQFPISFNPVDKVTQLPIPGNVELIDYNSKVNVSFLSTFGINEIPVLMMRDGNNFSVIQGKSQIIKTIKENCYHEEISLEETPAPSELPETSIEGSSPVEFNLNQFAPTPQEDEGACVIGDNC